MTTLASATSWGGPPPNACPIGERDDRRREIVLLHSRPCGSP